MLSVLTTFPHRGQWTGIDSTVALSSMSNAMKLCPQWGHVTLFAPLNIDNQFLMGQKYGFILPNFGSVTNQEKKPCGSQKHRRPKANGKGLGRFLGRKKATREVQKRTVLHLCPLNNREVGANNGYSAPRRAGNQDCRCKQRLFCTPATQNVPMLQRKRPGRLSGPFLWSIAESNR